MCVRACVHVDIYAFVCVYIRVHVPVCACVYRCISASVYAYMCVRVCVDVHVYACVRMGICVWGYAGES